MQHHVYFWLKDEVKDAAARAEFEAGLATLFEIPEVAGGRWAVPAVVELRPVVDQSWDYALTMDFNSLEDQFVYQDHPAHHAFIEAHKDRWARVLVMDLA
ncbi:MAG: Dabb family protein [Verrucomicrobia bacterium]|nr:Dabb family protein [Verrucomicrobiota bacterium]